MEFLVAAHTDVGIRKKTNQDSLMIKVANTDQGKVCLAVVCDGMGGLKKGELASAALIRSFDDWFMTELPELLHTGLESGLLQRSWERRISLTARDLDRYSEEHQVSMGTTLVAILLAGGHYFIINVGDSRAYELTDSIIQLTKDQSFVQREMDMGRMTPEEAARDPRRNVLLQCVGASDFIEPEFLAGKAEPGAIFLICSDGFRHVITPQEILDTLNPSRMLEEEQMRQALVYLTEMNKYRREDDNISAAAIRVFF